MSIEPHKIPLPRESQTIPSLPREVRLSMLTMFLGFWLPVLPHVLSIVYGYRILHKVKHHPAKFTGASFGWFALIFTVFQIGLWAYIIGTILGYFPPPTEQRSLIY